MATANIRRIELLDGKVTGIAVDPPGKVRGPLIVHLHGGGSNCSETVRKEFSILGLAADLGFPGVGLNRPGYAGSEWLDIPGTQDEGLYDASAKRIGDALTDLWGQYEDEEGCAGIVLMGCSVGSPVSFMIATRWAAGEPGWTWPLLGVAATDVGHVPMPGIPELWNSSPVADFIEDLDVLVDQIEFGPEWARVAPPETHEDNPVDDSLIVGHSTLSRSEALEIGGGWPREALKIASQVTVPVYWRVGEFDPLWTSEPEVVAEFISALRTSSPYVDGGAMQGASHAIHDGPLRRHMVLQALAFVELCGAAQRVPQILERRE
ncbi:alpha/beta fold hydrolase [Tessaracoccus caeni]|uniref:alpha/beta fold hydrolase n=1 Tax=Tessaracoccus caeni TaxID=3031239 RepID=UPI0023DC88F2|nr:alpha/beta hydrolase [Tessaracoccus caeni]MDF1488471.1 alpha/beta hydrolase [Tessaracoccus caeni]